MSGGTLAIVNAGTVVSGALAETQMDADTVVAADGVIRAVGRRADVEIPPGAVVVDAAGATVLPGLRDNHVHPVFGGFTPRQSTVDWIGSCLHGGVTTMFSAGEPHLPGRPSDPPASRPWPCSPTPASRGRRRRA